jgi:bacillithiol system protein YtxJ
MAKETFPEIISKILNMRLKGIILIIYFLIMSSNKSKINTGPGGNNYQRPDINKEWLVLTNKDQLEELINNSFIKPVLIYKHSTRCGLSMVTRKRLEEGWEQIRKKADLYYLDILAYREVSDKIALRFEVPHESPQILIISEGEVIYNTNHSGIRVNTILKHV